MAYASVTLKVSASNPSAFQEQAVAIKSYLPKGIRPENVLDAGGLEIGYDVKKGQCYVHKEVVLPAKGSASYNVVIDDIWLIREEDLEKRRNYTDKLKEQLANSEYAEVSQKLAWEIQEKIQSILDKQGENLVEKVTPIEHIGAYEFNQDALEQVQENIGILESMVMALMKTEASGGAQGDKFAGRGKPLLQKTGKEPSAAQGASRFGLLETPQSDETKQTSPAVSNLGSMRAGSCLSQEAVHYANVRNVSLESPKDIKLTIEVENPSETENQSIPVQYYLAEDVKASDVLDSGGLDVGFDFEKSLYYVFKDNVFVRPGEKTTFKITVRNKWVIDKFYLFTLKVHADNVTLALESMDSTVRQKNEDIQSQLDQLLEAKSSPELTEAYVTAFHQNQQKMSNVEKEIRVMEDMLVNSGAVDVMTPETKERLCEEEREKRIMAAEKGVEAVKEFKLAASTLFKGKALNGITTWQLICGIVIFLGALSSSFYYVQIKEQKSAMLDPLTGVFSRGYITERFREELKIARNTNTRCSLLVLDIDKFKAINDTYGHTIGDTILKEFVIAIRKGIRATDMVGRFGGDEFLIILPTGEKERARKIAEGVVKIVEKSVIKINQQVFSITTSIGVATYPEDSGTAEDMFSKADNALYMVKRKGGNGIAVV